MNILWLSRHSMTTDQLADLKRIYGEELNIHQYTSTVSGAKEVIALGNEVEADVLAVVLPPSILADLTNPRNNTKPVIRAIAKRVPTGSVIINPATMQEETEYMFQHDGWEQVLKIVVETKRL